MHACIYVYIYIYIYIYILDISSKVRYLSMVNRNSWMKVFCKNAVLKNSTNFTGKHL